MSIPAIFGRRNIESESFAQQKGEETNEVYAFDLR
jgi:hypothetical protein